MGFLWVTGFSFFHCVASPFHSFVTSHHDISTGTAKPASAKFVRVQMPLPMNGQHVHLTLLVGALAPPRHKLGRDVNNGLCMPQYEARLERALCWRSGRCLVGDALSV